MKRSTPFQNIAFLTLFLFLLYPAARNEAKEVSQIKDIRLGQHSVFSRLVFDIAGPIYYTVEQVEDDSLLVKFCPAVISSSISWQELHDSVIREILLVSSKGDEINIAVYLRKSGLAYRHFILDEKERRLVLDIYRKKDGKDLFLLGEVSGSRVNIRNQPDLNSPVVRQARSGEIFKILSSSEGWYEVYLDSQNRGYISRDYIVLIKHSTVGSAERGEPLSTDKPGQETAQKVSQKTPAKEPAACQAEGAETIISESSQTKKCHSRPEVLNSRPREPVKSEAQKIYNSGLAAFKQGEFKKALLDFKQLMERFPESELKEPVLFLIGDCYFNLDPSRYFQSTIQAYQRAISTYPKSRHIPKAYWHLGLSSLNRGYHPEAMAYLGLIAKDYPDSPYAPLSYLYKGKHLYEKGRFKEAREDFRKIIDYYHDSPEVEQASLYLAKCLFRMGWFEQAEIALANLYKRWPDLYLQDSELLYCMGENLFQLKDYQKARDYLFRAFNLFPQMDEDHSVLARIGDCYYSQGRKKEAVKIYRITENLYPGTEGAAIARMRLLEADIWDEGAKQNRMLDGDREVSKSYLEIINKDPGSRLAELAMFKLARFFYEKKDYMKCISVLREMIAKYPDSKLMENVTHTLGEALLDFIKLYRTQGRHFGILDFYSRNREWISGINKGECFLYLGEQFKKATLYEQAIELYQRADVLLWKPEEREKCLFSLGEAYFKNGSYAQARSRLEHLLEEYPSSSYTEETHLYLGKSVYYAGDYVKASQIFEQMLKGPLPEAVKSEALYFLGLSLEGLGKFSEAARVLAQAGETRQVSGTCLRATHRQEGRGVFEVYYRLGNVLLKNNNYSAAIEAYKTALTLDEQNEKTPSLLYHLGKCYLVLKQETEARWAFNRVLETTSQDDLWKEMSNAMLTQLELDQRITKTFQEVSHEGR